MLIFNILGLFHNFGMQIITSVRSTGIIQIGGTLATYGYITDAHTPRCRSG